MDRISKSIELSANIINAAKRLEKRSERKRAQKLARMMQDPKGKAFTAAMTDECFRSKNPKRIASQLIYLLKKFGTPTYLSFFDRLKLTLFKYFGNLFAILLVPMTKYMLRQETKTVILPGEKRALKKHLAKRRKENIRINLNHLGEAILGEAEAKRRLNTYLEDLKRDDIDTISVKISTLYSQIHLIAWDHCLKILEERLSILYRAANDKLVNLDMEEYRDLHLTVALFKQILSKEEFKNTVAGIVLQSYLPDSYGILIDLTEFAKARMLQGGAPIRVRIVKGANLAMEKVEASLKGWPQAPYTTKEEVDANYKKMVLYALQKENAEAVHIGIASHNLLDISFALILRQENKVQEYVTFEMLEGMADATRRVVQELSQDMLLYCPVAKKEEFQNAVAYLIRRLDENTGPQNFLRDSFDLSTENANWKSQVEFFKQAFRRIETLNNQARRFQDRFKEDVSNYITFKNEPDTDWALPQNRLWADTILDEVKHYKAPCIPLVVAGDEIETSDKRIGVDPSIPGSLFYHYCIPSIDLAERALNTAQTSFERWSQTSSQERFEILGKIAQLLRIHRKDLISAMIVDAGKTIPEADSEVSEAIDFAEYYRHSYLDLEALKEVKWRPKGVGLVISPWNFPCAIPAGGMLAALVTGNCVIFKPSSETPLVAWKLVNLFWESGIPKDVLQFLPCPANPIGDHLIRSEIIRFVILTGSTDTAKHLLKIRPGLELMAETGGKNAMIITDMADCDLAIKDLLHSAFSHSGQKCSAASLAILEAAVYDDPQFFRQLKEATESLIVGSAHERATKINPLIKPPQDSLKRGLSDLEEGEAWLCKPKTHPNNPSLWSPGIKIGVKPSSFSYKNELFGPVLSIMRADNLEHALSLANGTSFGLTAGIHSLDDREQEYWLQHIKAGNCYINRTMTGAIVQRQPFGGCKESSFGPGAKAGGPNYLLQFMEAEDLISDQNYEKWWKEFNKYEDPSKILGQDNYLIYKPRENLFFRIQDMDREEEIKLVLKAASICGVALHVSREESEELFLEKVLKKPFARIRFIHSPSQKIIDFCAQHSIQLSIRKPSKSGRVELLHYLREISVSRDYHRYGNLGLRENSYIGV